MFLVLEDFVLSNETWTLLYCLIPQDGSNKDVKHGFFIVRSVCCKIRKKTINFVYPITFFYLRAESRKRYAKVDLLFCHRDVGSPVAPRPGAAVPATCPAGRTSVQYRLCLSSGPGGSHLAGDARRVGHVRHVLHPGIQPGRYR